MKVDPDAPRDHHPDKQAKTVCKVQHADFGVRTMAALRRELERAKTVQDQIDRASTDGPHDVNQQDRRDGPVRHDVRPSFANVAPITAEHTSLRKRLSTCRPWLLSRLLVRHQPN